MSHKLALGHIKTALLGGDLTSEFVQQVENLNLPQHMWQDFRVKGGSSEHLKLSLLCLVKSGRSYSLDSIFEKYNLPDQQIQILLAYCLVSAGHTQKAKDVLDPISPPSQQRYLFWFWLTKALVATHTKTDFFDMYQKTLDLCSGHEKGSVYLNFGAALESRGEINAAISSWREALDYLELPSYALALSHYNLGQALLAQLAPEATEQFIKALDVARYACAANIKSTALCGLGDCKRLLGTLSEAKNLYTRALATAKKRQNNQDQINAHAKLGYVAVLENEIDNGLEQLNQAIRLIPDQYSNTWVYTIEALCYLKHNKPVNANQALTRASVVGNIATERKKVLLAELERQNGNLDTTRAHLLGVNLENVGARELVSVLPELFAWAAKEGLPIPAPIRLERHIRVQTLGETEVYLNGQKITLPGRAFELLVYMLYYKERTVNEAIATLYFEELTAGKPLETQKNNFHKTLERLRMAFLWDGILEIKKLLTPEENEKNVCVVGQDATWQLDWVGVSPMQLRQEFLQSQAAKYRNRMWVKNVLDID
jgi:tetratricopeptide (TPR) repeat protein